MLLTGSLAELSAARNALLICLPSGQSASWQMLCMLDVCVLLPRSKLAF